MNKKICILSAIVLCVSNIAFAAPQKSNTTMSIDYENIQQLIKNQYAAREGCKSIQQTPETSIMCQYADAASEKLNQLGYCMEDDSKPTSEWQWHKCSKK